MKLSLFVLLATYASSRATPGLRGAEDWALEDTAVEEGDDVEFSSSASAGAEIKSRANAVAAMARDPSEPSEAGDEETPPESLFANPIGEDYPVRGFVGNIYSWNDDWDDDAPSDEIDAVYWKSTH